MASIPHDVVNAFLAGKPKRRGAFQSSVGRLTSYELTIATRSEDGKITIHLPKRYFASPTTNIHLSACAGLYDSETGETLRHGSAGYEWVVQSPTHE